MLILQSYVLHVHVESFTYSMYECKDDSTKIVVQYRGKVRRTCNNISVPSKRNGRVFTHVHAIIPALSACFAYDIIMKMCAQQNFV